MLRPKLSCSSFDKIRYPTDPMTSLLYKVPGMTHFRFQAQNLAQISSPMCADSRLRVQETKPCPDCLYLGVLSAQSDTYNLQTMLPSMLTWQYCGPCHLSVSLSWVFILVEFLIGCSRVKLQAPLRYLISFDFFKGSRVKPGLS
jgi:hypothetical protein